MSDMKMYDILGKFKNLDPEFKPLDQVERASQPVYQEVEPRGSITQAVNKLQESFAEFKEAAVQPKYDYPDVKQQRQAQAANDASDADLTKSADPELAQFATQARFKKARAKNDVEAIAGAAVSMQKELEKAKAAEEENREALRKNQEIIKQTNDRFAELNAKVASGDITPQDVEIAKAAQDIEKQASAAQAAVATQPTAAVKQIKQPTVKIPTQMPKAVKPDPAQTQPAQTQPAQTPTDVTQSLAVTQPPAPTDSADTSNILKFTPRPANPKTKVAAETKVAEGWFSGKDKQQSLNFDQGPVLNTTVSYINFNNQQLGKMLQNPQLNSVPLRFPDGGTINLTRPMAEKLSLALRSIKDPNMAQSVAADVLGNRATASRYITQTKGDKRLHFFYNVKPNEVGKAINLGLKVNPQNRFFSLDQENPNATQSFGKPQQLWVSPPRGKLAGTQQESLGKTTMKDINTLTKQLAEAYMGFKEDAKPDFLDLDKDGDTEEPMKQAAKQAKEHEPAKIDKDAVAKRKRLQAIKDRQEDERAEKGEDTKSASRFVKGRAYGGAAQKDDEVDEASYSAKAARAGKDIGKPGKNFAKIAKSAGKRYGSKAAGERVAGAVLNKLRHGEELEENGLQYYTGKKKYGKEGMTALAKAGRAGASQEELGRIKDKYTKEDMELSEKAVSKQQQKFMGMVHAVQKGKMKAPSKEIAKTAKGMTKKAAHDFAATKHKGLPTKVAEGKEAIRQHPIYTDKDAWDHYKKELDEQEMMDGVRDVQQELDEIAKLAGVPIACPKCSSAPCKCEESVMDERADLPSVNVNTPLSHELSDAHCVVCNEAPCVCSEEMIMDETMIDEAATRKDFRKVAELIRNIEDKVKRLELATHHADIFKQQNPRFSHEKFYKAAGVDECDWNMNPSMTPVEEAEMEEGNEFSGALAKARAAGAKEFEVDGKKYTVKEDINLNVSAVGEEDVVNLIRKLSGMEAIKTVTDKISAITDQACPACGSTDCGCEEELDEQQSNHNVVNRMKRDVENLNTPREDYAAADITTMTGTGLDKKKTEIEFAPPIGDNPLQAKKKHGEIGEGALWKQYEDMLNEITK